jgi:hypothetical protein
MQLARALLIFIISFALVTASPVDEVTDANGVESSTASLLAYRGGPVEPRPARK